MRRKKMRWDLDSKPSRRIGPETMGKKRRTIEDLIPKVDEAGVLMEKDDHEAFFEPDTEE